MGEILVMTDKQTASNINSDGVHNNLVFDAWEMASRERGPNISWVAHSQGQSDFKSPPQVTIDTSTVTRFKVYPTYEELFMDYFDVFL